MNDKINEKEFTVALSWLPLNILLDAIVLVVHVGCARH